MMNQILAVAIGIPAIYLLFTLITFVFIKNLRTQVAKPCKEVTQEWVTFMKKGIPIPTDYKRMDTPFPGDPILKQPELQTQNNTTVAP